METKVKSLKIYSITEEDSILLIGTIETLRGFAIDHLNDMIYNENYEEDYEFSVEELELYDQKVLDFIEFWGAEIDVVAEISKEDFERYAD